MKNTPEIQKLIEISKRKKKQKQSETKKTKAKVYVQAIKFKISFGIIFKSKSSPEDDLMR